MKLVTLFASFGMLIAAVSSEAPVYGAPAGPSSVGPDPLAGINLAQLLSLVSQAGAGQQQQQVQQSYGAPVQQQQQQRQVQQSYGAPAASSLGVQSFSAPIAAQQVAYFGTQQTAQAQQGGYNNAQVSSFQASPVSQYGAPSTVAQNNVVSSQYGAPALRQQSSFNTIQRAVSQQYGAPSQQNSGYSSPSVSQFSGSARAISSQYGAPSVGSAVRSNGGYSNGGNSNNNVRSGYSSSSQASSAFVSGGGYSSGSQSQVQSSSSAINGGYSSGSASNLVGGGQQGGYSSGSFGSNGNSVSGGYSNGGNNGGVNGGANNFQGGNGGDFNGGNGGAAQQRVHKHVYIHVAPPEESPAEQRPKAPRAPQVPEKHYKILFIKAPAPPTPEPLDLSELVTPAPEQKTLVYVLLKKPEATQEIRIPTPAPTKPSKPEVYFIRYKSNNDGPNNLNNGNGVNGGNDLNAAYGAPQIAAPIGQPLGSNNNPNQQYGAPSAASSSVANGGYN